MFEASETDQPERILRKLTKVVETLFEHAEDILKQYNTLRNGEFDDSARTQICRKVFEESEKLGVHRRLLFSFYKSATELHKLAKETSADDNQGVLKLMVLTIDGMKKFHKLQDSAEQHMKQLKNALEAAGEPFLS